MSEILRVEHLKKYFKTPRGVLHAVDDVSFSIDAGKTLGVVGESGCGKSTLGRTVIHLLDRTEGRIVFDGRDISDVKKKELKALHKDMQMIFQDPYSSLNPRMTVSQIIADPLKVYRMCSRHELEERVFELMDTVGLARRFKDAYPHELDGGRRQRIGIARALSLDPKFIVCDEPVSALDVSIQAQILNLLHDLQEQRGLTFVFITHDMSVVKHISHEIAVMYLGCLVEKCETKTLFRHPIHPYTQALLGAIPRISSGGGSRRSIILKGEISNPVDPKPGCRFAPRCPFATEVCNSRNPELKEVCPGHFVACHNVAMVEEKVYNNTSGIISDT